MYTFKSISDKNGGLYLILKEDITVAYLRIRFGVVNLYPVVDNDICWGIVLDSWIYDDIDKIDLTEEETSKIFSECENPITEFLEELEKEEEPKSDEYDFEDDAH